MPHCQVLQGAAAEIPPRIPQPVPPIWKAHMTDSPCQGGSSPGMKSDQALEGMSARQQAHNVARQRQRPHQTVHRRFKAQAAMHRSISLFDHGPLLRQGTDHL